MRYWELERLFWLCHKVEARYHQSYHKVHSVSQRLVLEFLVASNGLRFVESGKVWTAPNVFTRHFDDPDKLVRIEGIIGELGVAAVGVGRVVTLIFRKHLQSAVTKTFSFSAVTNSGIK
jgi:hypothetical protein